MAIGGDSAGGNLAAVVSQRLKGGPAPCCQLLIYPGTDFTLAMPSHRHFAHGFFLEEETIRWFRDHYLSDADQVRHPEVSPLFAEDVSGAPPTLLYTAGFDPLRDEGIAYAERLRKAEVPVTERCFEALIHGFVNMRPASVAAARACDVLSDDLARALRR